jgi:hypothetical protein
MAHGVGSNGGEGPRRGWNGSVGYKLVVVVLSLAFLAPNLWAIVQPYEDWPYTSLPMYAPSVDRDTPRYRFIFLGELSDGPEQEVSTYSVGVDYAAMRFFFMYVYGSVETGASPFNRFPDDTRRAFEDRLSRFFAAYTKRYEGRFPARPLKGVRLQGARLRWDDNAIVELHELGRYDVASGRFTHTWMARP